MNTFFGGQGFDIIDRDRGITLSDNIDTQRFPIQDNEVNFENAWGIFAMRIFTNDTSNAVQSFGRINRFPVYNDLFQPQTFCFNGKIDLPQGDRDGAVKVY